MANKRVLASLLLMFAPSAVVGQRLVSMEDLAAADSTIAFDTRIEGRLEARERVLRRGSNFQLYEYRHTREATRITIQMSSADIDSYLIVLDNDRRILEENDDDPHRVTVDSRIDLSVEAGERYLIVATSLFPEETGAFTLTLTGADDRAPLMGTQGRHYLPPRDSAFQDAFAALDELKCTPAATNVNESRGDAMHPRTFVQVHEQTRNGDSFSILSRSGDSSSPRELVRAKVDRHSKVVIDFERELLRNRIHTDVEISIKATVDGRPVEVPGYSQIGEQQRTAVAHIRNLLPRQSILCTAGKYWSDHGRRLAAANDVLEDTAFVRYGRELLRNLQVELNAELLQFTAGQDRSALASAARIADLDAAVMLAAADRMLDLLNAVAGENAKDPTPEQLREFSGLWDRFAEHAVTIGKRLAELKEELPGRALMNLKTTEIVVETTGARPGEVLDIRVENRAQGDELARVLILRLEVAQFGLVQGVRDAVGLVWRQGVSRDENAQTISQFKAAVQENGFAADTILSLPANHVASPGVTYGWSWYPRRVRNSDGWTDFIRWLNPSVGISVLFPRFGEQEITVAPVQSVEAGDGPSPSVSPSVEITDRIDPLNIAAGPTLGLFNNAVQLTIGWNMSVHRDRFFVAWGFSFAEIAGATARAVGATEE